MSAQPPPPPPDDSWPTREEVVVDDPRSRPETPPSARPSRPPPDEPDRRLGKGLLLGIAVVAIAAAAIAAGWFLTRDDDSEGSDHGRAHGHRPYVTVAPGVAVPRVIGLNEKNALVRIAEVGLRPKEVYSRRRSRRTSSSRSHRSKGAR